MPACNTCLSVRRGSAAPALNAQQTWRSLTLPPTAHTPNPLMACLGGMVHRLVPGIVLQQPLQRRLKQTPQRAQPACLCTAGDTGCAKRGTGFAEGLLADMLG